MPRQSTRQSTKTLKKKQTEQAAKPKPQKYVFAVGRRKTAIAKVKLYPEGSGEIKVNSRTFQDYFPTYLLQQIVATPLSLLGLAKKVNAEISASGGGIIGQAQAARLGLARALIKSDPASKTVLKKQGLLTRDARKKERKKPGLKRARRAPQWQKR